MRLNFPSSVRRRAAMTLVEMMMAFGVFTLMMTGLMALHIFGLKMNQLTLSKLGASDQARDGFGRLMGDIRSSSAFEVGMMGTNYPFTNFTSISSGYLAGTALKLSYEQTTNVIIYYFNPTNYSLYRYTNGVAGSFMVVSGLTNTGVFRAESYQGTNLTAGVGVDQYSMVGVFMEFYQFQYPLTRVGTGSNYMYDYYKMEFKASSRNYN